VSIKPLIPGPKPPKPSFNKVKLSVEISNDELIKTNSCAFSRKNNDWPYEEVQAINGNYVKRIRSSIFQFGAIIALLIGITLMANSIYITGLFLVLTLFPILILYPILRFLLGGKDSVLAIAATVITEEVLKSKISKVLENSSKNNF
jgi:hypothetical protein